MHDLSMCFIGPPGSPTIRSNNIRVDGFTISWTTPQDHVDNVCGAVMYSVTLDGIINTTTMTNITYTGLSHATDHTVIVTPYNNAGEGTSANITVMTSTGLGQDV